jgi:hypothetical protein
MSELKIDPIRFDTAINDITVKWLFAITLAEDPRERRYHLIKSKTLNRTDRERTHEKASRWQ